jgi:THO complex subunit 1
LTRLWNINPNNLESCRGKGRDFLPRLDEYFEEAIAQLDPAAAVEDEYKKVNDGNFGWRGLRLLAQRSPYFFTFTNNPINKLPDYLTISLKKLARDLPQQTNGTGEDDEDPDVLIKPDQGETQEEAMEQEDNNMGDSRVDQKIPSELLVKVAEFVGDGWKKLAVKIGFDKDMISELESNRSTGVETAENILKIWADEDVDATVENLEYMLEGLGFLDAAKVLQMKEVPSSEAEPIAVTTVE